MEHSLISSIRTRDIQAADITDTNYIEMPSSKAAISLLALAR